MEGLILDPSLINELFPFNICLDDHFKIVQAGPSMVKLLGVLNGERFEDHFIVQRPYVEALTIQALTAHQHEAFYIRNTDSGFNFKGVFKFNSETGAVYYLNSLYIYDIEELKSFKLVISDFASHDPTIDFLHSIKQSEIHRKELSELISRVDRQSVIIKKNNIEISRAKVQLESILDEMTDIVWSLDLDSGHSLFLTPSVQLLTGYRVDEFQKDPDLWKKIINEPVRPVLLKILAGLKSAGAFDVNYVITTKSGELRWINNSGKYICNADGKPVRIDGVILDRTEQHRSQEILDQEIRLQEALIDIASTYINLDPGDVENTINRSLEKMGLFVKADRSYIFGYDVLKGTVSNTYEWCHGNITPEISRFQDLPPDSLPQWRRHMEGEVLAIEDVAAMQEDGLLRSFLMKRNVKSMISTPMMENGELAGFVGFESVQQHYRYSQKEKKLLFLFAQMLINIGNRQKWENQLRRQEEKFRNIIANMNLGLLEVDPDDTIIYANQSFCEISGYALHELKGQKAEKLFMTEEKQGIIQRKNELRKENVSDSYEVEVQNKLGENRWWFVSGAPNYNDKGQLIGSIGIHLDITEQKRLEQELAAAKSFAEAAGKAKELFLANMSHEIRTPLNVIIGMVRLLTKEPLTKQQQFFVRQSESSARHLLTILNNILDIAKIESGELHIIHQDFSLSTIAYNLKSLLYSQATEKKLEFRLHVDPRIFPAMVGDELRLNQVLINLLGNAIKFTETGFISLKLDVIHDADEEQEIEFLVEDSGIGMSEEFMLKIFDKFSQEQLSSARKFEGTGLGMAIAYDLVNLMGGRLEVRSYKGLGSKFRFVLKFKKGDPQKLVVMGKSEIKNAFEGYDVLIVEDNEMNRFIAAQSLSYLGVGIDEADNGLKAVEMIRKKPYDLVLMDIQMPEMDGVQTTEYIRNELKMKMPVIALTANAFRHDIELYMSKGMDDYITKPFDEHEFLRKIEHYLSLSKVNKSKPSAQDPLFDLSAIREISAGDEAFINKMKEIFVRLAEEQSHIFRKGLENNDVELLRKSAHKLKPSVDQLKIVSIRDKIRLLEKYPEKEEFPGQLASLVHDITDTLEQVCAALTKA